MQKTIFIYEPTYKELKAIEDSWLEDFQENKQALTKWFQEKLLKILTNKN